MRRITSILILVWIAALIQGCGTGSFLGQRYDNFTAYYNTFYNAERVFDEGYDGIGQSNDRIDRSEFLPVFVRPESGSRAREFESAIEKSADVLRDHPDSKWVDDALLLIGKSYFYRENYVGAIQKFREVTSLGTGREAEGRFWLARTLIVSGAFDEAEAVLLAALADEELDRRWTGRYRLALGELNVIEQDWAAAATELAAGLDDVNDDDLSARAWFTLGQVYEKLDRYEDASKAYRNVRSSGASYELSYAAAYSANRVEGFYGDVEEALSNVRKMERDDKNLEYQSELRLLRAQILQRSGRDEEAFAIYSDLLYNPNRTITLNGLLGRIHYSLGELYRDIDGDYVLAAAHFDTARTNLRGSARQAVAVEGFSGRAKAPEAIEDLDILSESFNAYAEVFADVARFDSLLHLGTMPEDEFDEKVLELRRLRAEELERQRELLEERERNQQFNRQSAEDPFRNSNTGLPPGKVLDYPDEPGSGSGFLGVEDAVRVQEGRVEFISRWGERPLVPNWRRRAAITNTDTGKDQIVVSAEAETREGEAEDVLPEIDISAVPRDSSAQVDMRRDRALARYELGNTLFLGMERPDSAAVWYRKVIDEGDSTDVAQRALYALAEVQYSLGDTTSASRLYRDILDRYPESDFSDNVRDRLGIERSEAPSDSSAVAMTAYSGAFMRWDSTDSRVWSRAAFNEMLTVAGTWPNTEAGARSLLSATEIHLEMAGADSARIFGPLPITVSDSLLAMIWPRKASEAGGADRSQAIPDVEADPTPDPLVAPPDSVAGLVADSTAMVDLPAVADSTATVDLPVVADSTAMVDLPVVADSARISDSPADLAAVTRDRDDERRPLSLFGHVALSDSLILVVEPPGATGNAVGVPPGLRFVTLDGRGALAVTQPLSLLATSIRAPDLIEAVERLHPRTPYAIRARQIGDLLDELLVVEVPVDSTAADSIAAGAVPADSLPADSVATDPVSATADSLANDMAAADSVMSGVAGRLRTKEDSLAAAELSGRQRFVPRTPVPPARVDSTKRNDVDRMDAVGDSVGRLEVPQERPPVERPAADAPALDVDLEALAEEGIRTSSSLKPLTSEGQADPLAVGWTLVIQSSRDIPTAQLERRRLDTVLGDDEQTLHLLIHTQSEEPEVLVGWGLFETREALEAALEAARAGAGDSFPADTSLLVLVP